MCRPTRCLAQMSMSGRCRLRLNSPTRAWKRADQMVSARQALDNSRRRIRPRMAAEDGSRKLLRNSLAPRTRIEQGEETGGRGNGRDHVTVLAAIQRLTGLQQVIWPEVCGPEPYGRSPSTLPDSILLGERGLMLRPVAFVAVPQASNGRLFPELWGVGREEGRRRMVPCLDRKGPVSPAAHLAIHLPFLREKRLGTSGMSPTQPTPTTPTH
ncbi:hypothetical protein B0H67DRAFT_115060 [Lasiosphaeris hirsuta]|uniref:Uncharacterized protein n=1 Tax=Lasiosphaeris hirsuta TaxID=260670 RepID=A0AA40AZC8_9PEZI|nr:hypothetical protein B0H67DRAFT_115060 [Lasiosphaeris hirsuta]